MGMFSWLCKGCGQELVSGELCRLDGSKGEYDGYGRCGNYDYECEPSPAAWHQACYQKATPEQKLDETPSKHAPNQGFGPAHLAFLPGYDPQAETKYSVMYETWERHDDSSECHRWFVTPNGPQDQEAFDKAKRAAEKAIDNLDPTKMAEMYGEWANAFEELDRQFANPPERNATQFATLAEAKQAAETALTGTPEYVLIIFGTQAKADGMVYRRDRHEDTKHWHEQKKSEIPGNPDVVEYKYERLGTHTEKVIYNQTHA